MNIYLVYWPKSRSIDSPALTPLQNFFTHQHSPEDLSGGPVRECTLIKAPLDTGGLEGELAD